MGAPGCSAPWVKDTKTVTSELEVNPAVGLADAEVTKRREAYGYNELSKEPPTPLWKLIAEQFDDTLVKILLASAGVSFGLAFFDEEAKHEGLRAYVEPLVILLILILNATVGVWQESRSEAALDALKELQSEHARVLRNGKMISDLPSCELVPGDIVELHVGDRVPADMRVLQLRTATVRAEQASLTGESVAVMKCTEAVGDANCELQAKENMLFSGTAISNGIAVGVITAIGMDTEIGKIQSQIKEASEEEDDTPLKKKLDEFGELLAKVIFWICVLVWLINYENYLSFKTFPGTPIPDPSTIKVDVGRMIYYLKIAVALAVAAIPEGLPAVITTCLALGTRTMAKKNAIVRKLPSVETLGCTTVICSDKTGTLTTNQMSVVQMCAAADATKLRTWAVTGHTYSPFEGAVTDLGAVDKALTAIAEVCSVCNEARLEVKAGVYRAVGAPTEAALRVLVEKLGVADAAGAKEVAAGREDPEANPEPACAFYASKLRSVSLLEFDRDRKSMSVLARPEQGANVLLVKGAAECVLERSTKVLLPDGSVAALTPAMRRAILGQVEAMAEKALRCLALAHKADVGVLGNYDGTTSHPGHKLLQDPSKYASLESDLVFVGLVGLQDPPRPEVLAAIKQCRQAGIRVMVITGDNKKTAEAICQAIGVFGPQESLDRKSFTGREFVELPREEQMRILRTVRGCVFSRAEPRHKQDIVRLLKELGEVTAMTGDGVNDAPALKKADVGIAVHGATDAARGAADIVLTEAGLSTIVTAVIGARKIFKRMTTYANYTVAMTFRICFTFGLLTVIYDWYFPTILIVIMAVFNDGAMIALSKDRVVPDKTPNSWNLKNIFIMGMVYGLYLTLSTWALYQTAVKTTFFEDKCDLFSLNDRHVELRAWCGAKLEREYLGAPGSGMPFDSAAQFDAAGSVCQIPGYGAQHHICPQGPVAPGGVLDGDQPSALHQCMIEQKYIRGAMTRSLLYTQVSISGQALVFVVRTRDWSLANRAGTATYIAFLLAQIGSSLIGVFGFGGYVEPRHRVDDCEFCGLSTGGRTPFFDSKVVPIAGTESDYTASVIGCTGYVIVAWIWSAIWYVLLDPIKWAMYWILNEDGFRDQVAFRHEKKRTLERSSKEQTGEVFNGPAGFAPANYANPLGRASMSKPVSAVLDRKSAALVPINRTSMTISNDPNRAMNIARRSFVGQGMQRRTSFERKSHEIHAASPKAADAPKH